LSTYLFPKSKKVKYTKLANLLLATADIGLWKTAMRGEATGTVAQKITMSRVF
jgi:hypothetical protein